MALPRLRPPPSTSSVHSRVACASCGSWVHLGPRRYWVGCSGVTVLTLGPEGGRCSLLPRSHLPPDSREQPREAEEVEAEVQYSLGRRATQERSRPRSWGSWVPGRRLPRGVVSLAGRSAELSCSPPCLPSCPQPSLFLGHIMSALCASVSHLWNEGDNSAPPSKSRGEDYMVVLGGGPGKLLHWCLHIFPLATEVCSWLVTLGGDLERAAPSPGSPFVKWASITHLLGG